VDTCFIVTSMALHKIEAIETPICLPLRWSFSVGRTVVMYMAKFLGCLSLDAGVVVKVSICSKTLASLTRCESNTEACHQVC